MQSTQLIIYKNGEYVNGDEAVLSLFDHSVLYGDAVFDTLCAWNGAVFKLKRHVDRLFRSLHAVRLPIVQSREDVCNAILRTAASNGLRNAYIKCLITRGEGPQPTMDPKDCTPNVFVFAKPYITLSEASGENSGLRALIASTRRIPAQCLEPKIKNINYLNLVLAKMEASDAGMDEAILLDTDGYVSEGPGYNLFAVQEGRLATPQENVLLGITRETILELARESGIAAVEKQLTPYDLYNADELFFTTTAGGVIPIIEVNRRLIGGGEAGTITRRLREAYWNLLESGRLSTPIPYRV